MTKPHVDGVIPEDGKIVLKTTNGIENLTDNDYETIAENEQIIVSQIKTNVDIKNDGTTPGVDEKLIFLKQKNDKMYKKQGVAGILARPDSCQDLKKSVLLLHGNTGNKNNLWFPKLSQCLQKMGYTVLRIDFRGLGDSEDCFSPNDWGRTIQQDVQDIETCSKYFNDILGSNLDTIMAHSRGVISMFEFQLNCYGPQGMYVPNLINCAGRFDSIGLQEFIIDNYPNWYKDQGYRCTAMRYGMVQEIYIPLKESKSAIDIDCNTFGEIDSRCFIMSIYGSKENIMPLSAVSKYNDIFHTNRYSWKMIDYANHDFLGVVCVTLGKEIKNKRDEDLPLTKKGFVNYNERLIDVITNFLSSDSQIDKFYKKNELIAYGNKKGVLKRSRFPLPYEISNILNFRDCGGYYNKDNTKMVKPGIFYRSANLYAISEYGLQMIDKNLHVKRVFDLRSDHECEKWGTVEEKSQGFATVENISFKKDLDPEEMLKSFKSLVLGPFFFPNCYLITLSNSITAVQKFFQYLIDNDLNEFTHSVVFHCAVGKDRTGLLGMLLLKVLGVDDYTICLDYTLTKKGLDIKNTQHTDEFVKHIMSRDHDFYHTALGETEYNDLISQSCPLGGETISPLEMNQNLLSSEFIAMKSFIKLFHEHFGSVDDFFIKQLKFTSDDILCLKNKYLV